MLAVVPVRDRLQAPATAALLADCSTRLVAVATVVLVLDRVALTLLEYRVVAFMVARGVATSREVVAARLVVELERVAEVLLRVKVVAYTSAMGVATYTDPVLDSLVSVLDMVEVTLLL
jgi:hypothetical protein